MFLKRETRVGVAVLVVFLALLTATPGGAAGLEPAWTWPTALAPRVLSWLEGLLGAEPKSPSPRTLRGSTLEKATLGLPRIDSLDGLAKADHGSQIDPNGLH